MSLATSIKEFSDILNQISTATELNGTFSYLTFLQELFLFTLKNLVGAVLYILSFNWLKDFSYLPLLAPQLNPSSYFEDSYFEDPLSHILSFSRVPPLLTKSGGYGTNQFISGFINSFFFSLPFSLPHLISMRRFLSQGVLAGVTSVLGTIAAHSLFLIGVLHGLRFLIIPWFSVEPLNYIVGILIVVAIVNELVQEKRVYTVTVPGLKQRQVNLLRIGALSFMLTWCEESTVFHSFNHLTLSAHNTYLDLYPSGSAPSAGALDSFLIHTTYLVAFILGNCLFSFLFYFLFLQSTQYISQWTGLALAKVARTLNKVVLFLIVAFTLSSFPYYGLDYLLGKVGGFLPEDPAYIETILSPTVIRKLDRDFIDEENGSKKKVVPLDVNYFDQGIYFYSETPLEEDPKEDFISNESSRARGVKEKEEDAPTTSTEDSTTLSFEELNYRGEHAWTFHDWYKKKGPKKKTGFLSGLADGQTFKKPKNHYMELKLKSDKRRAEAASQAADQIPLGRISEWKEGVLPRKGFAKAKAKGRETPTPPMMEDSRERPLQVQKRVDTITFGRTPLDLELEKKDTTFATEPMSEYVTELTETIFEDNEGERLLPIETLIKERYVFNPVYRTLLKTDIDAFLARQPSNHNLATNQEYNLAKKRQLLEKYYNWLRYYSPFEKELEQLYEIPQTKSFVDSVYHQQFKGTLQIARRLFSVTFAQDQTPSQNTTSESADSKKTRKQRRVLSYDQTLYTDTDPELAITTDKFSDFVRGLDAVNENPFLHEQLLPDNRAPLSKTEDFVRQPRSARPLKEKEKEKEKTKSITTFENLESSDDQRSTEKNSDIKEFKVSRSPFIEESNSSPIYAGWDDRLRQFVVTNKFNLK